MNTVTVVGAGLAGSEAVWQLAQRGVAVTLLEMKPKRRTPAARGTYMAELVCSNSLRSRNPLNAVGLLKEEMRRLNSLIMRAAAHAEVPAGDAWAVDREVFGQFITQQLRSHPNIEVREEVVTDVDSLGSTPALIATGPLTADELAQSISALSGQERLYFYDALAPIVSADSLNREVVYAASRYGKGNADDYLNCPLDQQQYEAFVDALLSADAVPTHEFEKPKYFEGCLPVEVIASRGKDTLRYGCMKPVGLPHPSTCKEPYAVLQLRKEDRHGQAYNLVGFQTKLRYPEQKRVFGMIPGLENANFLRLGAIHRNTYLDSPSLLGPRMEFLPRPNVRFAGQITGVEGYVESAAHGLITALLLASDLSENPLVAPPATTALGALLGHVTGSQRAPGNTSHEPQNINWAMFPPLEGRYRKSERKQKRLVRAVEDLEAWSQHAQIGLEMRSEALNQAVNSFPKKFHPHRKVA